MTERQIEPPRNTLTFDVEHWHSATLIDPYVEDPIDRLEESIAIVLDLLDRHDVSATFFVLGEVAEEHPDLVRRIADAGHELASHGHTHTPLYGLTVAEFEDELVRSAAAIERASGLAPIGFRAPNFSIDRETSWAFGVLGASEYEYDSSVFPLRTPMYGVSGAPIHPYRVDFDAPLTATNSDRNPSDLVEFPMAVLDTPVRVPIAGGFYVRMLPLRVIEWGIRRLNEHGYPATVYAHPWEFNPNVHTDAVAPHKRFVSFHGIGDMRAKFDRLLRRFEFGTIASVFGSMDGRDERVEPPRSPV